jgi:exopolysaccharide production protein ExoZ
LSKLRSIQVLRCVAVLGVLACHSFKGAAGVGSAGVDLFFVISGFIITRVAEGRSASEFLMARLRRIYPIYWLAVLPWLALVIHQLSLPLVASSVTLWPIFGDYVRPALPAAWTLSFEMMFYLAFAASLAWGVRAVLIAYACAALASLVFSSALFGFLGNFMVLEFLVGVLIAKFEIRISPWWALLAIAWFALAPEQTLIVKAQTFRPLYYGIPAALLFASVWHLKAGRAFAIPVFLGDASYSIYLVHQLALLFGAGFFTALAAGSAVYVLVERRLFASQTGAVLTVDDLSPPTARAAARQVQPRRDFHFGKAHIVGFNPRGDTELGHVEP